MRISSLAALTAGLATLAVATSTVASPEFPAKLQEELDMECAPVCTLCHQDMSGGLGTLNDGFGDVISRAGLFAKDTSSVAPALKVLEDPTTADPPFTAVQCPPDGTSPCDTDEDGVPDVTELREGTNPNQKGGELCLVKYGCGARVEPRGPARPDGAASLLAALTMMALWVRARRNR